MATAPVRAAPALAATDTLIDAGAEPLDGANEIQLAALDAVHPQPVSVTTSNRSAPPAALMLSPDRLRAYVQAAAA